MANDTAISALMKLPKEQMMHSLWPTPEEGILINTREKEWESCSWKKNGNLLWREVEHVAYLVSRPLVLFFGQVLEAKIALLASRKGFWADQESAHLAMTWLLYFHSQFKGSRLKKLMWHFSSGHHTVGSSQKKHTTSFSRSLHFLCIKLDNRILA